MAYAIGVIVLVVGIIVSVALHELGHMIPAKRFGVRVSQYMVGFGPTIWSRTKGETEYGFKWILAGGYVRLIGMYPPAPPGSKPRRGRIAELVRSAREASADEILPGQEPRAFYNLSAPKKLVVMLGGPVMNLVIAFVLLTIVQVGFGELQPNTTVLSVAPCVASSSAPADATCTAEADGTSPAAAAGLREGDRILAVDGVSTPTWDAVSDAIQSGTRAVTMEIERDGTTQTVTLTPRPVQRTVTADDGTTSVEAVPVIGIGPGYSYVRQSIGTVPGLVWEQVSGTVKAVATLPVQVAKVAQSAFGHTARSQDTIMSVVGVGRVAGEVTSVDTSGLPGSVHLMSLLSLLASLNIALFVFNLIPLPPLDGGHVVGAVYEGTRRQVARWRGRQRPAPADTARLVPIAYGAFLVLTVMGALLMYADIVAPVPLG